VLDACAGGVAVSWVRRIMSPFESTSKPYGRYGPQEGGSDPLQHCQMERWYWERENCFGHDSPLLGRVRWRVLTL
jgi:hypothetical protein